MKVIPYSTQEITQDDIDAVVECMRSDYLTQGPRVEQFETELLSYVGSQFAVTFNSATSALHATCKALGVSEGDIVWTSPISFVASSNAALYCGASVDFVDIELDTYNISVACMEEKLKAAQLNNTLPKAVIIVHMAGQPCDLKGIYKLSKKFGFLIIEDASHALGAEYCESRIGDCAYSDACVFSFHPVKMITSGEGGAITTNNQQLAEIASEFRSHGITRQKHKLDNDDGDWFYEQKDLGFNYRLTDISLALGISQLKRINENVNIRNAKAKVYDLRLSGTKIIIPSIAPTNKSSFHLYPIRCPAKIRKTVYDYLRHSGIGVNVHYIPIYKHPYYKKLLGKDMFLPNAETYYQTAISIPLHTRLEVSQQEYIVNKIIEAMEL